MEYRNDFLAQFQGYLATQPPIVRGLHIVLKVLAMICFALPIIFFVIAAYYTILWVATGSFTSLGEATYLPLAGSGEGEGVGIGIAGVRSLLAMGHTGAVPIWDSPLVL